MSEAAALMDRLPALGEKESQFDPKQSYRKLHCTFSLMPLPDICLLY